MPAVVKEPFCFWCGGNARILFECVARPIREDLSYCVSCASIADLGIAIHEVTEVYPGCNNPEVAPGIWFTGRWVVVRPQEAVVIYGEAKMQDILKAKAATLHNDVYHQHRLDHYPWRTIQ